MKAIPRRPYVVSRAEGGRNQSPTARVTISVRELAGWRSSSALLGDLLLISFARQRRWPG